MTNGARVTPGSGQAWVDALQATVEATLLILASVEARYDSERQALQDWHGPDPDRERLMHDLEQRRSKHRETIVTRLASLHQQIVSLTMFQREAVPA
jgi:hypothetical protein